MISKQLNNLADVRQTPPPKTGKMAGIGDFFKLVP